MGTAAPLYEASNIRLSPVIFCHGHNVPGSKWTLPLGQPVLLAGACVRSKQGQEVMLVPDNTPCVGRDQAGAHHVHELQPLSPPCLAAA